MADLDDVVRLRAAQDRISLRLARGVMLAMAGRDLSTEQPAAAARLVLPGLLYARELSWAIGLDLCRAFAPGGDVPGAPIPFYSSQMLVTALGSVLRGPAPTPAKLSLRAVRHAEQANRETVVRVTQRDQRATGWARVANGDGCGFCTMLVSRGPVYGEAGADFRSHDRCRCSAVPVYGDDWPGREQYERASAVYTRAAREPGDTLANLRRIQRTESESR